MSKKFLSLILIGLAVVALSVVATAEDRWLEVAYTDTAVSYDGFWRVVDNPDAIGGSELMGSRKLNTFVEFTFTGTGVRWIGTKSPAMGYASVYVNDELMAENVDGYNFEAVDQQVVFELTDLPEATHVIRIVPDEAKSKAASMSFVSIDGFQFIPTLEVALTKAGQAFDQPVGGLAVGDPLGAFYPHEPAKALIAAIADAETLIESGDQACKLAAVSELNRAANELAASVKTVVIPDRTGDDRVGEISGGPTWIDGPIGRALSFNGEGDRVKVDNIFISETSSIEFWLRMPQAVGSGWQTIIACLGEHTDRSPGLWHQGDGNYQTLHLSTLPNWTGFNHIGPEGEGSEFDPDIWYHIALVKDGAIYTLYINAEEIISVETGEGMTPGDYLEFGQRNVDLDDLRVWDRVRTAEEIAADYQQPLIGDEAGLIGYWPFERVRIK